MSRQRGSRLFRPGAGWGTVTLMALLLLAVGFGAWWVIGSDGSPARVDRHGTSDAGLADGSPDVEDGGGREAVRKRETRGSPVPKAGPVPAGADAPAAVASPPAFDAAKTMLLSFSIPLSGGFPEPEPNRDEELDYDEAVCGLPRQMLYLLVHRNTTLPPKNYRMVEDRVRKVDSLGGLLDPAPEASHAQTDYEPHFEGEVAVSREELMPLYAESFDLLAALHDEPGVEFVYPMEFVHDPVAGLPVLFSRLPWSFAQVHGLSPYSSHEVREYVAMRVLQGTGTWSLVVFGYRDRAPSTIALGAPKAALADYGEASVAFPAVSPPYSALTAERGIELEGKFIHAATSKGGSLQGLMNLRLIATDPALRHSPATANFDPVRNAVSTGANAHSQPGLPAFVLQSQDGHFRGFVSKPRKSSRPALPSRNREGSRDESDERPGDSDEPSGESGEPDGDMPPVDGPGVEWWPPLSDEIEDLQPGVWIADADGGMQGVMLRDDVARLHALLQQANSGAGVQPGESARPLRRDALDYLEHMGPAGELSDLVPVYSEMEEHYFWANGDSDSGPIQPRGPARCRVDLSVVLPTPRREPGKLNFGAVTMGGTAVEVILVKPVGQFSPGQFDHFRVYCGLAGDCYHLPRSDNEECFHTLGNEFPNIHARILAYDKPLTCIFAGIMDKIWPVLLPNHDAVTENHPALYNSLVPEAWDVGQSPLGHHLTLRVHSRIAGLRQLIVSPGPDELGTGLDEATDYVLMYPAIDGDLSIPADFEAALLEYFDSDSQSVLDTNSCNGHDELLALNWLECECATPAVLLPVPRREMGVTGYWIGVIRPGFMPGMAYSRITDTGPMQIELSRSTRMWLNVLCLDADGRTGLEADDDGNNGSSVSPGARSAGWETGYKIWFVLDHEVSDGGVTRVRRENVVWRRFRPGESGNVWLRCGAGISYRLRVYAVAEGFDLGPGRLVYDGSVLIREPFHHGASSADSGQSHPDGVQAREIVATINIPYPASVHRLPWVGDRYRLTCGDSKVYLGDSSFREGSARTGWSSVYYPPGTAENREPWEFSTHIDVGNGLVPLTRVEGIDRDGYASVSYAHKFPPRLIVTYRCPGMTPVWPRVELQWGVGYSMSCLASGGSGTLHLWAPPGPAVLEYTGPGNSNEPIRLPVHITEDGITEVTIVLAGFDE